MPLPGDGHGQRNRTLRTPGVGTQRLNQGWWINNPVRELCVCWFSIDRIGAVDATWHCCEKSWRLLKEWLVEWTSYQLFAWGKNNERFKLCYYKALKNMRQSKKLARLQNFSVRRVSHLRFPDVDFCMKRFRQRTKSQPVYLELDG